MRTLFTHIKELAGIEETGLLRKCGSAMNELSSIENAFLLVEDDRILDYGEMAQCPVNADKTIDVTGKTILPSWCDSHTHIVFAEPREKEFLLKIEGNSYAEIAAAGGGILNSANKLQNTPLEDLYQSAAKRLENLIQMGTGAIEIKSGYGLTLDSEIKMLEVIQRLKENYSIPIKASFLGAHAYPANYRENKKAYIQLIIDEMLPVIADRGLADYMDVFCEHDFFSVGDTDQLLQAAAKYGLKPKIHANQLAVSGGVQVGVKNNAVSVDHLENIDEEVIESLKNSNTIATLLPSCSFFINIPFAPARTMIDHGLSIAIASDYNPGSTPSGNMNFVISLACIKLKMKPAEAIHAATINGAYAMELSQSIGSITKGKLANFIITKPIPSITYLPYSFGENCIEQNWIKGKRF